MVISFGWSLFVVIALDNLYVSIIVCWNNDLFLMITSSRRMIFSNAFCNAWLSYFTYFLSCYSRVTSDIASCWWLWLIVLLLNSTKTIQTPLQPVSQLCIVNSSVCNAHIVNNFLICTNTSIVIGSCTCILPVVNSQLWCLNSRAANLHVLNIHLLNNREMAILSVYYQ